MDFSEAASTALAIVDSASPTGVALWTAKLGAAAVALKNLPGVASSVGKALTQLVLGASDIGAARLEVYRLREAQEQQQVRDMTSFNSAVVARAIHEVQNGADPFEQRAKLSEFFKAKRAQENREAVAGLLLTEVAEQPPAVDTTAAISDDWLAQFGDIAGKVSTDSVRKVLARMLRGEVAAPGSMSIDAVARVATLTPRTASQLAAFRKYACSIDGSPLCILALPGGADTKGMPDRGLDWHSLCELAANGLVIGSFKSHYVLCNIEQGEVLALELCGRSALLRASMTVDSYPIRVILATMTGSEILRAMDPPEVIPTGYLDEVRTLFAMKGLTVEEGGSAPPAHVPAPRNG